MDRYIGNRAVYINFVIYENQNDSKEVTRGCADCSVNPMVCSVPTIELPGDEDFER